MRIRTGRIITPMTTALTPINRTLCYGAFPGLDGVPILDLVVLENPLFTT